MGSCNSGPKNQKLVVSPDRKSGTSGIQTIDSCDIEKRTHSLVNVNLERIPKMDLCIQLIACKDYKDQRKDKLIGNMQGQDDDYKVQNQNNGITSVVPHLSPVDNSSLFNRRRASLSPVNSENGSFSQLVRKADRHLSQINNLQGKTKKRKIHDKV